MLVPQAKSKEQDVGFEQIYDELRYIFNPEDNRCWSVSKLNKLGRLVTEHGNGKSCFECGPPHKSENALKFVK
jgi:hypothetical protein